MRRVSEDDLTPRQREVLQLAAEGKTYEQIAAELKIEYGTVRSHLASVRACFQVSNTMRAVTLALSQGIIANV